MPRLSVDVITEAEQYVNAVRDRELNLRGGVSLIYLVTGCIFGMHYVILSLAKKIPAIENLGATLVSCLIPMYSLIC